MYFHDEFNDLNIILITSSFSRFYKIFAFLFPSYHLSYRRKLHRYMYNFINCPIFLVVD